MKKVSAAGAALLSWVEGLIYYCDECKPAMGRLQELKKQIDDLEEAEGGRHTTSAITGGLVGI